MAEGSSFAIPELVAELLPTFSSYSATLLVLHKCTTGIILRVCPYLSAYMPICALTSPNQTPLEV